MVEQTTQAAISPSTGRTLPDRYIEGTCPICGYDDARGDQCDNCGNQLDATDLIDPRSKINGETPQFVDTQHFFLDLPALADALGEWLDEREASGTWRPNVIKFSQNILKEIRPRAMTRDIDWGIPVPGWEDQPTKRLYVWFDAVIGYLSASIEWARRSGDAGGVARLVERPRGPVLLLHGQGQHRLPLPDLAGRAAGLQRPGRRAAASRGPTALLNLPTEVVSSEFLTMGDQQFSTSRGHVIYVGDMLARYGPDALRYFICAAGPETSDADFTWAEFVHRNNSELVAGWGNLVNRTATMIAKSFGEIPPLGELEPVDEAVLAAVRGGFETVGDLIGRHRQRAAIAEAMRVVGEVNKYLTVTEPYKMKDESQRERLATVLHVAVQCVSDCNTLLAPFLPHAANKVHRVLGGEGELRADAAHRAGRRARPRQRRRADVVPGHHRRLHRHPALGVAAGHGGRDGREADAGLHQARPVGGRRGAGPRHALTRLSACLPRARPTRLPRCTCRTSW